MTKRILDYDAATLTTTFHEFDPITDVTTITEVQDIEPYLRRSEYFRKDDDYTKKGIQNEMWHYASIPNAIVSKMLAEDGIDVFSKAQEKEVLKLLNTKYQYLKHTRKRHC